MCARNLTVYQDENADELKRRNVFNQSKPKVLWCRRKKKDDVDDNEKSSTDSELLLLSGGGDVGSVGC